METIKIGLIGLGTVGAGVLEIISDPENQAKIENTIGRKLAVKTIVVHNPNKPRPVDTTGINVTTDVDEIVKDPEIYIVVEVMGGIHPANEIIEELLQAGKNVVTANKDLIASNGPKLSSLANANGCDLMYEASVAGGIPILRTITNSFTADQILEVKGIVNGTTNFILTQMRENQWSYDHALKRAQELGFAEADPTNDVAGIDAAYKMIILSLFAFGTQIKLSEFNVSGIENITDQDVKQAGQWGYVIKLMGVSKLVNEKLFVEVAPTLVPKSHPMAVVDNENNAVMVTGAAVGDTLFYGPGAGGLPTANSVLSDITSEAKNITLKTTGKSFNSYQHERQLADPADVKYSYYLAMTMPDVSGQMLAFTTLMTKVGASFERIEQTNREDKLADVAVITHAMTNQQLAELKQLVAESETLKLDAAYKVLPL